MLIFCFLVLKLKKTDFKKLNFLIEIRNKRFGITKKSIDLII